MFIADSPLRCVRVMKAYPFAEPLAPRKVTTGPAHPARAIAADAERRAFVGLERVVEGAKPLWGRQHQRLWVAAIAGKGREGCGVGNYRKHWLSVGNRLCVAADPELDARTISV